MLDLCIDKHKLYTSDFIVNEVRTKLRIKFKVRQTDIKKAEEFISNVFTCVQPKGEMPRICRDSTDNNILHLASFVKSDLLITGDKDLLVLNPFGKTKIISPSEFMRNYHI